jgi:hypothetical protein
VGANYNSFISQNRPFLLVIKLIIFKKYSYELIFQKIKEAYPKCVIHDVKNYLNFSIGASIVYKLRI